jgi:hypothetical protein
MKKVTLCICLSFFIGFTGFSQTVNGIPVKELKVKYIRVIENEILSRKINIQIDYGQVAKLKNLKVLDENGNPLQFNSMIDALNYMDEIGYEVVNSNDKTSSFLLRKKEPKI